MGSLRPAVVLRFGLFVPAVPAGEVPAMAGTNTIGRATASTATANTVGATASSSSAAQASLEGLSFSPVATSETQLTQTYFRIDSNGKAVASAPTSPNQNYNVHPFDRGQSNSSGPPTLDRRSLTTASFGSDATPKLETLKDSTSSAEQKRMPSGEQKAPVESLSKEEKALLAEQKALTSLEEEIIGEKMTYMRHPENPDWDWQRELLEREKGGMIWNEHTKSHYYRKPPSTYEELLLRIPRSDFSSEENSASTTTSSPSSENSGWNPFQNNRNLQNLGSDAIVNLNFCKPPETWRGCAPMSQWLVHNSNPLEKGWRVLELVFYSDRICTQALQPSQPLSSGFLPCGLQGSGFHPLNAHDSKSQTMWVSSCGTESADCDGVPEFPADVVKDQCRSFSDRYDANGEYKGGYVGARFTKPQAVQCVRLLQAGNPYRSEKITITSHNENDCYICANNALNLQDTFNDGFDTYIGTPGVKVDFFTNLQTWTENGITMSTPKAWPMQWTGPVTTENLNFTSESHTINFPLSTTAWDPKFPGPLENYMARWQGLIRIRKAGIYTISLSCDTVARLLIDDIEVLNNPGNTTVGLYFREERAIELQANVFYFEVQYKHIYSTQNYRNGLILEYKGPDTEEVLETTTPEPGTVAAAIAANSGVTNKEPPKPVWKVIPLEALMRGITNDQQALLFWYDLKENMHCHDTRYMMFGNKAGAQAACDADPKCSGIYGRDCNLKENEFEGLFLCRWQGPADNPDPMDRIKMHNSTENSCVFVKLRDVETTTIAPSTAPPIAPAHDIQVGLTLILTLLVSITFWVLS